MSTGGSTNEGSLWGARFAGGPSPELARLSRSIHFDWQLAPYDIAGSRAHAKALAAAGYLDTGELERMVAGLDELQTGVQNGSIAHCWRFSGRSSAAASVPGAAGTTRSQLSSGCICSTIRG